MFRIIYENEDLRGVTINNPGSFLYVGGCTLGLKNRKLTTFIGDCTAADFINNTGLADYSKADTYAAQWRGNTNMEGSKFPSNIGYLHHEPVAEILRQGISKATGIERTILEGLPAWVRADYSFHSWNTGWSEYASKIPGATPENFIVALTLAVEGYPGLEACVRNLGRDLLGGTLTPMERMPPVREVEFFDSIKATLDTGNLPALTRPQDRYELAQKIKMGADALSTGEHLNFVQTIDPPVVIPQQSEGDWLLVRKAGL